MKRILLGMSLAVVWIMAPGTGWGQIISTVAGGGTSDGKAATSAKLFSPGGVDVDREGNLYIVEWDGHRLRKVDASSGLIATIAGDGTASSSGDGNLAVAARLHQPSDVFVRENGDIYIAERGSGRIRKIDAETGIITTVAGNGGWGFSGDGGLAIEASLQNPHKIYLDDEGNIFIVEGQNHRIRRVDAQTGIIT